MKKLEYMTVGPAAQYYFSLRKCDMPYSVTKQTFPMVLYSPICVFDIFFSIEMQYVSMLPAGNNMSATREISYVGLLVVMRFVQINLDTMS